MQLYILGGFGVVVVMFLVMVSVQLFKIEKIITDATDIAEYHVMKKYKKQ